MICSKVPSECSQWVPVDAPWMMTLQNLQHSTCAMLLNISQQLQYLPNPGHPTKFWAAGYAKWPVHHWLSFSEYFHISRTKIINPKAASLNRCHGSNVHDGLAIPENKSRESVKFRPRLRPNNAWIWGYDSSYTTWQNTTTVIAMILIQLWGHLVSFDSLQDLWCKSPERPNLRL